MAKMDISTKCACGEKIRIQFKKPTRLERSVKKAQCSGCKSQYMLACFIEQKPGLRKYNTDIAVLELTEKAKDAIHKKLKDNSAVA